MATIEAIGCMLDQVHSRLCPATGARAGSLWREVALGARPVVSVCDDRDRRHLVARCESALRPWHALTEEEHRVLSLLASGRSVKAIGHDEGLSFGTLAARLSRARTKVGARSRLELVSAYRAWKAPGLPSTPAPPEVPDDLGALESRGGEVVVLSFARAGAACALTPAECGVVTLILQGCSNGAIARRRGTSQRTVANQVARIMTKLGVHSRLDLVVLAPFMRAGSPPSRPYPHRNDRG